MADYELSNKADEDLTDIYIFSYRRFGEVQADAYLFSLEESFSLLAQQPSLGRKIDHIRPGYFRHEHASHSVFYKRKKSGVKIMRVLHRGLDTERHL